MTNIKAAREDRRAAPPTSVGSEREDRNEVSLRGRLSGPVEVRDAPSGDRVAVWRLVVRRSGDDVRTKTTVDTIDCESFAAAVVRRAPAWADGARVSVEGTLRRRFWQTPAGARSRYVVDVRSARKVE